jgi:hypothetical protein
VDALTRADADASMRKYIVGDLQPFSQVNSENLKNIFRSLKVDYTPMSVPKLQKDLATIHTNNKKMVSTKRKKLSKFNIIFKFQTASPRTHSQLF